MEALLSAGKIIMGVALTTLINKFLTLFRFRQLYLSFDDILECTEEGVQGHTASLKIYNRGKDKEKTISIIFSKNISTQILSSNYPSCIAEDNTITIDRLLPGKTVSITVFLSGTNVVDIKAKPLIKSEDANGRVLYDRGNVPPSLGPLIWFASIVLAFVITVIYLISTDKNPFTMYSNWKNADLVNQGLYPSFGTEKLISLKDNSNDSLPIKLLTPRYEKDKIILSFQVYNPTKERLSLNTSSQSPRKEFWADMGLLNKQPLDASYESLNKAFWKKYGYETRPEPLELEIDPKQNKIINISRRIIETSTIDNLNLSFRFDGIMPTGEEISDRYEFFADKSNYSAELTKYIEAVQQSQTK